MMRRTLLALGVLTWCAAARADGQGAPGVPAALATDVSARASERGISAGLLLAPLSEAAARGVPPELVSPKVLEGISKGISPDRIAAVARELTGRLAEAEAELRELERAGLARPADRRGALLDLAAAGASGVGRREVEALVAAARASPGAGAEAVVSAAHAVGELARRGVPPGDAMSVGLSIARRGPRPPGEMGALFDAWRAEGGRDAHAFTAEAARRIESGRKLDGMVDVFADSHDRITVDRGAEREHGQSGLAGSNVGGRGADQGLGPAERPDGARGAVPGLDDAVRGKGKGQEPKGPRKE